MTWTDHAIKPVSFKNVLAWVSCSKRPVSWTLYAGAVYKRTDEFVTAIYEATASYTEASSSSLSAGEYFYDITGKTLYIRMDDDSDPNNAVDLRADYRFFFSTSPINLPHDLSTGEEVPYDGRISTFPKADQRIEATDMTGIAVESSGNIAFHNGDGYFDDIFDTYIFENKIIRIFSYSVDGYRNIFKGYITRKTFTSSGITFGLRDTLSQLESNALGGTFSSDDGTLSEEVKGRYKRIVYGKTTGLMLQGTDQIVDGITGTGTISSSSGSATITGSSTIFKSQIVQNDIIVVGDNSYTVDSIASNTSLTISEDVTTGVTAQSFKIQTERPVATVNRSFFVADHKCSQPSTTITTIYQLNRFEIADSTDLHSGDRVLIGSTCRIINTISGNIMTITQNLESFPSVGTTVVRSPIINIYYRGSIIPPEDYTVTNTTECKIVFEEDMELNRASIRSCKGNLTFTSGSSEVVSSESLNYLKVRDYVYSGYDTYTFYMISEIIDETSIRLSTNYAGSTIGSTTAKYKPVFWLLDTAIVTADIYGKEDSSGALIRTGASVVKDILSVVEITDIDSDSFDDVAVRASYLIDLKLPLDITDVMPKARKIISYINQSVLANLTLNEDYDLVYSVWDASLPTTPEVLRDDDIVSYKSISDSNVYKTVVCRYRHFDADRYSGKSGTKSEQRTSDFVTNYLNVTRVKDFNVYLYDESSARNTAEGLLFINALSSAELQVTGPLALSRFNINDKLIIDFRRMYKRFGSTSDSQRVYVVTRIKKDGKTTLLGLSDAGNSISRTSRIADDSTLDFSSSDEDDRLINGFIVDDDKETPNDSTNWNNYLIGA